MSLNVADGPGPSLIQVGSRIRMIFPHRPEEPPDSMRAAGAPRAEGEHPAGPAVAVAASRVSGERRADPGPATRHPGMILEFEPIIATRLIQRSSRLLASGIAAAAVMMVAASVFWRLSRRYDVAQRHLEKERRLSLLGEMSAVLAHEIRNPLASLKGHAQLLSEHLAPETADRRKAELVVAEATRLEILTADLLDFARTGPLDLGPVEPARLVRECAEEVAPGGFQLELEDAPDQWRLDAKRVRGALTNLLRNAREASPPGSPPEVRVSSWERQLLITVRDHGKGLPPGLEERIFDPFFTTRANGTGLGLSVARRIAEMHGGALTAANHAQGGAVFEIALPAGRG